MFKVKLCVLTQEEKKEIGIDEISFLIEAIFPFPRSSIDLQKDYADFRLGISQGRMSSSS